MPYCSQTAWNLSVPFGKSAYKTFEPSKGAIGTKLKIPKTTFTKIIIFKKIDKAGMAKKLNMPEIFKRIAKIIATEKLLAGPDKAINPPSFLGFFKLFGLNGTGLAHPKSTGLPMAYKSNGNSTDPNGSMCLIGFKVNLPASLAVESPNLLATNPCETS